MANVFHGASLRIDAFDSLSLQGVLTPLCSPKCSLRVRTGGKDSDKLITISAPARV